MDARQYRGAIAGIVRRAAESGFIPRAVRADGYVVPLTTSQRAHLIVDRLAESDLSEDWHYVGALQPELSWCISWLRRLQRLDDDARTAEGALEVIRGRVGESSGRYTGAGPSGVTSA